MWFAASPATTSSGFSSHKPQTSRWERGIPTGGGDTFEPSLFENPLTCWFLKETANTLIFAAKIEPSHFWDTLCWCSGKARPKCLNFCLGEIWPSTNVDKKETLTKIRYIENFSVLSQWERKAKVSQFSAGWKIELALLKEPAFQI